MQIIISQVLCFQISVEGDKQRFLPFLPRGSTTCLTRFQLRNDALFQQHLHVSDELRRHLEENAAGECFIEVAADDVEPVQLSPPADSPIAPSCITSRSLEASQTFMTPLRFSLLTFATQVGANVTSDLPAGTTPASQASAMQLSVSRFSQLAGSVEVKQQETAVKISGIQLAQPHAVFLKNLSLRSLRWPLWHPRRCKPAQCYLRQHCLSSSSL